MTKLSFVQKKLRSVLKRFCLKPINKSDTYFLQHFPEWLYREDFDLKSYRAQWVEQTPKTNLPDFTRLLFFIEAIRDLEEKNVRGAFAELGVYKGTSAKLMLRLSKARKLYLFDTFKGFESEDLIKDGKQHVSETFEDTSIEKVQEYLSAFPNCVFCPGHFPKTTKVVPSMERFALVHLDADLYDPTKSALEYFYPRLNENGIIIVHDCNSGAWPGVKKAVYEFEKTIREGFIPIPDKSGTVVLKKRKELL